MNSISLMVVCAVLSGCGDINKQKSVSELITEVGQDSQRLSELAQGALAQALGEGVPLSSDVMKILEGDIAEGLAPTPTTAKDVLAELEKVNNDIEVLNRETNLQEKYGKIWSAKVAKSKALRELFAAKAAAAAADRAAGNRIDPDDDILLVPNNSFDGVDGVLTPYSPIAIVARAAVLDLFSSTPESSEGRTGLTVRNQALAAGEFRVILPSQNGVADGASVLQFQADPAAFAGGVGTIVEQWLRQSASSSGGGFVIPTHEAVRQIINLGLNVGNISGAFVGAKADSALVASLTNIGALEMVERSEAFRALTQQQQQLALRAAVAIAHSTSAGGSLRLEDRFNAVVLAIGALQSGGTIEARTAAVRLALQNQGVTNPVLLVDTIRALTVITQTSDMSSQDQARILGTVLMIANNSGGVVTDADFAVLVAAVRSNPQLLLGNGPTVPMPARFTLDPTVMALLRSRMVSMDTLPWSATSTSAAFIQAAGQQTQQLITSRTPTDPISGALVTGLAAARHAKNSLVPTSNTSVGAFGNLSTSGLSLAQTIQLLPTTTALDILGAAQDVAIQAASVARAAVLPLLTLTDGSSAANIPIDPVVEIDNFMEKYHSLIGSVRHTALLSQLKSNIEGLRGNGNFRRFTDVPAARGTSRAQGLDKYCQLQDGYAKLLYSANERDEIVIPRLIDFILNSNKLASSLSYYTNAPSGDGSKRDFDSIKGQDLYNKVLIELGMSMDTYLSDLRQSVFDLMYPVAPRVEELSAGTIHDVSGNTSLRQARTAATGLVDRRAFNMNGVSGQSIELGMPLFVQLKGDISSAKSTEAATGSVAYRLGNTVIGAIQGYANSGADFGIDSRQLETSVVASHSFGAFFVEGQVGTVSATEVHNSNWSGLRSQVTLGLDTEFVSPFVQLAHRQLDRSGLDLNETTAYVGLDAEVAKLAADTYSIDTRLLTKVGYGSKNWSSNSKDLGSTTGFSGSVEWSASLNLNSGVTFSSNLALDTLAGSSAAVNVSLDR